MSGSLMRILTTRNEQSHYTTPKTLLFNREKSRASQDVVRF